LVLQKIFIFLLLSSWLSCKQKAATDSQAHAGDSAAIVNYIEVGNEVYATKASYESFLQSLLYYDSAYRLAIAGKDTSLIAKAVLAKGRAYDAINKDPQKTIAFYSQAALLYSRLPDKHNYSLYVKYLVAHSYEKIGDSLNCINTIKALYNEIVKLPDSTRQQLHFVSEMALVCTRTRTYELAEDILQNLTKRAWIKNDSIEIDYLDHYFLAKTKLEIFKYKNYSTPYLDSLEQVFNSSKNFSDSAFYSNQLQLLYTQAGPRNKEYEYKSIIFTLSDKLTNESALEKLKERLAQLEADAQQKEAAAEQRSILIQRRFLYLLSVLLIVISALALFLVKRNRKIRKQHNEIQGANQELQEKNMQNELLHQELHHRVKNNLQMILSLVYMQERKADEEASKQSLQDIRLRIESIAALHQQMMPDSASVMNLKSYFTKLVHSVTEVISPNREIETHLAIDEISLDPKQSFPLGLLINEWVTNSIKYAAVADGQLSLYLTVKRVGEAIVVHYKDSGTPVEKTNVHAGLGSKIIQLLVAQIEGELERDEQNYFDNRLTIPYNGA
jgi:two-component sensor histidine kinase